VGRVGKEEKRIMSRDRNRFNGFVREMEVDGLPTIGISFT